MSIDKTYYSGYPDSLPYGLPSAAQVEEWANAYFSGFDVQAHSVSATQKETTVYSPTVLSQQEAAGRREIRVLQGNGNGKQNNSSTGIGFSRNSGIIVGTKSLEDIRKDFPILSEKVNGHNLVWLDNGATTQKPKAVIDRLSYFYQHENSNVHRGAHELAARSTDAYEGASTELHK